MLNTTHIDSEIRFVFVKLLLYLKLKKSIKIEDLPLLFVHLAVSTKHIKTMFGPGVTVKHC